MQRQHGTDAAERLADRQRQGNHQAEYEVAEYGHDDCGGVGGVHEYLSCISGRQRGEDTTRADTAEGIAQVVVQPTDTGHNREGIREVVHQIEKQGYVNLHIVFGVVEDKNLDEILSVLPQEATYYFCKADIPRGLPAPELHRNAERKGLTGTVHDSVSAAYSRALAAAGPEDMVFVGGSTFVVAELEDL